MITFSTIPKIILAKDPFFVDITSDNYKLSEGSGSSLTFNIAQIFTIYDNFTISIDSVEHNFSFTESPDDSGTQLGLSLADEAVADYIARVILPALQVYYPIVSVISVSATGISITLTALNDEPIKLSFRQSIYDTEAGEMVVSPTITCVVYADSFKENFRINVELVDKKTGTTVIERRAYEPNENGLIQQNFSQFVRKLAETNFDIVASGVTNLSSDIRQLYFRVFESYGVGDDYTISRVYNSDTFYLLQGATNWLAQAVLNATDQSWYNEQVANRSFLTNAPNLLNIVPGQKICLKYLHLTTSPNNTLVFQQLSDGTVTSETETAFTGVTQYSVYQLLLDFSTIDDATDQIKVWIKDVSGSIISEIRTYNVDRTYYSRLRYFVFRNPKGAYDTVYATGIGSSQEKLTRVETDNVLPAKHTVKDREIATADVDQNPIFKVNFGWLNQYGINIEAMANYLRQLLGSTDIYELVDGTLIPIRITNGNTSLLEDEQYLNGDFEISYTRAFVERGGATVPIVTGGAYTDKYSAAYEGGGDSETTND